MSDLPTPTAQRLRKPSWRDSRLLVGLLLVLASTAIGAYVVSRADDRVPMYAAKSGLMAGQPLTSEDVVRVDVQLGESAGDYLGAAEGLPEKSFVLREVRAGELIPQTAVGGEDEATARPVTLQVDATSASTLREGSIVDVYVNRPARQAKGAVGTATFAGPNLALPRVTVVSLAEGDSMMGGAGDTRAVQVMVPEDKVRELVGDVDLGSRITLVAVPGALDSATS
ncbi:hypothetical protein [Knoellia subterranea]|uniref:SAF domain-containing protein n=1 Tax=Knoellia subterranea KCTC 19937 TaxID=1385521 RepID=A0A0A0JHY4_9MICO|nr:hypothetical protein [Knoellia subterranea]KGN36995.1 hypothetical protein N803_16395 [Knoellia subterranea KCTC 19937]